ncbi:dsDNA nuclease domain-containing protein [Microbulbifer sp. YPW16]|uniref:dsDNA nuclease domain-containing protein n=1 Tax=Microbulbifer sp. YPW16 TaxID=2904242 RepID=UPI001E538550|nr:dsDNA nuclease domain-containing protein [Microbulbifer sp. YPW16]UHQ54140.1 dsDNA nuclease domain-containing protein [Microbulbifer sp. YPW16]
MAKSDSGGIGAKKGFLYQDYVAALNALYMLLNKSIKEIRCEVSDDIDVVYDDYVEYVQVKTTKAEKAWQIGEFTKTSYKEKQTKTGKKKKEYGSDSILHKSLDCDKESLPARFRIVTPRDICANLSYLKVPLKERKSIDGRCKILKSLRNRLKNYRSPNNNDVEYWLDNAVWEVIPSIEQMCLEANKIIMTVAYEHFGIHVNPTRDPQRILNDLLVNIIEKSATSIVLRSEENKIYNRTDFIDWFRREVMHCAESARQHLKVYTTDRSKLEAILDEFLIDDEIFSFSGEKSCRGLKGSYHRKKYNYINISKGIRRWLPEVLLRPNELADQSPENLEAIIKRYAKAKAQSLSEIDSLIANVLLHSTIRTSYGSQPVAASLYVDDGKATCFDNIHIIVHDHAPDILLMGFSHLIIDNVKTTLEKITDEFDHLLESDAFSNRNEKILEDKEDGYLLKHDVDDILKANTSLDENLDRFLFAFFLGYETNILKCSESDMVGDYLIDLKDEVRFHFQRLIEKLIKKDSYFEDLHLHVYIYPIPSVSALKQTVRGEMEGP